MALPAPPASIDRSAAGGAAMHNAFLNKTLGDCTVAAGYHILAVLTGGQGPVFIPTDDQIRADFAIVGKGLGGAQEWSCFDYWSKVGFVNGDRIIGIVEIDAWNRAAIQHAIHLFQNVWIAFGYPQAWTSTVSPQPFYADGWIWDTIRFNLYAGAYQDYQRSPLTSLYYHDVPAYGYDSIGVLIDSWGHLGCMTWDALAVYSSLDDRSGREYGIQIGGNSFAGGGVWALLTTAHIPDGKTVDVNGNDWPTLISLFNEFAQTYPCSYTTHWHAGQRQVRRAPHRGRFWRQRR
jgi:hypothetical protein